MVRTLNADLGERGWQPIVYRERHHDHARSTCFYRLADFCMVTSLHDGMNLVAKEFVAARDEDDGVLILSRFPRLPRAARRVSGETPTTWRTWPAPSTRHHAAVEERRDRMSRIARRCASTTSTAGGAAPRRAGAHLTRDDRRAA